MCESHVSLNQIKYIPGFSPFHYEKNNNQIYTTIWVIVLSLHFFNFNCQIRQTWYGKAGKVSDFLFRLS